MLPLIVPGFQTKSIFCTRDVLQDRTHAAELLRAAIDTENAKLDGLAGDVELAYAEKIEVSDATSLVAPAPVSTNTNKADKDVLHACYSYRRQRRLTRASLQRTSRR